jgi:hypothetical protein
MLHCADVPLTRPTNPTPASTPCQSPPVRALMHRGLRTCPRPGRTTRMPSPLRAMLAGYIAPIRTRAVQLQTQLSLSSLSTTLHNHTNQVRGHCVRAHVTPRDFGYQNLEEMRAAEEARNKMDVSGGGFDAAVPATNLPRSESEISQPTSPEYFGL